MPRYQLPTLSTSSADAAVCGPCGGKCCKRWPGIPTPEDFGAPDINVMSMRVLDALLTGKWAIDWWDGDPRTEKDRAGEYLGRSEFLRPAIKGDEGRTFVPTYGGPCTFLGESGCTLPESSRPRQCRGLVPHSGDEKEGCREVDSNGKTITKHDYVLSWFPYKDLLNEIGNMVRDARDD